jgi:hypothetical protein
MLIEKFSKINSTCIYLQFQMMENRKFGLYCIPESFVGVGAYFRT